MTDKGNDPRARAQAAELRNRTNRFVAPQYQNRRLTTPVDVRATLTAQTQGIQPTGRYAQPIPSSQPASYSIPMVPFSQQDLKYRNIAQVMHEAGASAKTGFPAIPGVGKVFADDAFFAYVQDQREKMIAMDYDQWRLSQIDFSTPEARAYWEKRDPTYAKRAMEQFEKNQDLQKSIERIRLFGYKDMDDMWLKFLFDKKLLPGYFGTEELNQGMDFLLPEYQNMYQQIGLNMQQPSGRVQPNEETRPAAAVPRVDQNGVASRDQNQPPRPGEVNKVIPGQ